MAGKPIKKSFDLDLVRSAATRRWPEILSRLSGHDAELFDGEHHPCPKCGGTDRFRMIDQDAGALLCNNCFKDRNGDGFAAIQWLLDVSFVDSLKKIAGYLGIEPDGKARKGGKNADPAKDLKFLDWNAGLAETWCVLYKPGITPAAMLLAGCKLARYRDQFTVFALPVWGHKLTEAEPVGWCLYNVSGGTLPKRSKDGKAVSFVKTKLTFGSQPGLIGPVARLAECTTIWKTEGPTDLLALLSLELPDDTTAVTNANGAGEKPAPWMLELWAGKHGYVVHDADQPGERGAAGYDDANKEHRPGWAEQIATRADGCWHVRLPYPVAETHGKDVRDFVTEGHTYGDLLKLSEGSTRLAAATPSVATGPTVIEAEDDPHRLARMNLQRYAMANGGRTLRFWRDEWYVWNGGHYRIIKEKELRAKISLAIKAEFDRLNIEQQLDPNADDAAKEARKVTKTMVSNVIEATAGMTVVSSSIEPMTWLPTRERRSFVALKNGILDMNALMADDDDCMLAHSPEWFSTVCLPFPFDPNAKCDKWLAFLEHNLEGDPERINLLQEWAGYLLLPDTGQQKFLMLEGEGSNGKSVFLAAITAMLGKDNVSNVSLEVFGDRFSRTDTLGKLANVAGDCEELDKVAEGYIKSFTSGDRMFFDRKGVSGINCVPTARLMISCNERPRFRDRSRGIWRRMLLVPWRVEIQEGMKVRNMDKADWWEASGELPGIFNWAVVGLHRLQSQGHFTASSVSREAIGDYQREMNSAKAFLTEFVEPVIDDELAFERTDFLYEHYVRWAKASGHQPFARQTFSKEIARTLRGCIRKQKRALGKSDRYWVYAGLRFASSEICGQETMDQVKQDLIGSDDLVTS